jgi:hypothetical protein
LQDLRWTVGYISAPLQKARISYEYDTSSGSQPDQQDILLSGCSMESRMPLYILGLHEVRKRHRLADRRASCGG